MRRASGGRRGRNLEGQRHLLAVVELEFPGSRLNAPAGRSLQAHLARRARQVPLDRTSTRLVCRVGNTSTGSTNSSATGGTMLTGRISSPRSRST